MKPKIVVAGASGFVGRALLAEADEAFDWCGISRRQKSSPSDTVSWKCGDWFSLLDAERCLEGARYAIYLVHSMMPSARLTQGRFTELDLIAADNFARAAAKAGVEQIIYLSGIIPKNHEKTPEYLSSHLRSRLEVEKTLSGYGVPVTTLRAGLILGHEGSSFQMLLRLVKRLPAMICPGWTQTKSNPIALQDVIALISFCLANPKTYGQTYDIGGEEHVSYRELIELTAELAGVRRVIFNFPLFTPGLSTLWVQLITGAPRELVKPLVQSLRHDMSVSERRLQEMAGLKMTPLQTALRIALEGPAKADAKNFTRNKNKSTDQVSKVRSVQRLHLPEGQNGIFVAEEYMRFLPKLQPPILRVVVDKNQLCHFYLRGLSKALLLLQYSPERSSPDRPLFYIRGGLLAVGEGRGRLEFREVLGGACIIAAIHDFRPRLPWYIYRVTQALVHLWVMGQFEAHLKSISSRKLSAEAKVSDQVQQSEFINSAKSTNKAT